MLCWAGGKQKARQQWGSMQLFVYNIDRPEA